MHQHILCSTQQQIAMLNTAAAFTFESAHPHELDALMQLAHDAYKEYEGVIGPAHWQTMRSNLENKEQAAALISNAASIVCRSRGELAGVAYLVPSDNPTPIFSADWAYIRMLGVLPAFRGQGLGRILTEHCINIARNNGERTIALHTSEFQNAARHIYESMGFQIHSAIGPRFGKQYWVYTLSL